MADFNRKAWPVQLLHLFQEWALKALALIP